MLNQFYKKKKITSVREHAGVIHLGSISSYSV